MVKHGGFAKCALFWAEGCGAFSGSLPGTADSAGANGLCTQWGQPKHAWRKCRKSRAVWHSRINHMLSAFSTNSQVLFGISISSNILCSISAENNVLLGVST